MRCKAWDARFLSVVNDDVLFQYLPRDFICTSQVYLSNRGNLWNIP